MKTPAIAVGFTVSGDEPCRLLRFHSGGCDGAQLAHPCSSRLANAGELWTCQDEVHDRIDVLAVRGEPAEEPCDDLGHPRVVRLEIVRMIS